MMVGTVPYMSPEQARGRPVDRRSDIWSLGCVLYECLTGRRAFDGETATDVLAKILERDPSWERAPGAHAARVRELVQRCLEKDVRRRIRDAGDVRIELERAREAREWTSTRGGACRRPCAAFPPSAFWGVAGLVARRRDRWHRVRNGMGFRSSATCMALTPRTTTGIPLRLDVTDP